MIVRFDMDGVLADFDGDYTRRTGANWDHRAEWSKEQKWSMLNDHPFFFRDLPWMPGAQAMFHFVRYSRKATPGIMSAASSHIEQSADQKRIWLDREIPELMWTPDLVTIVEHKHEKAKYALPGDILVDDYDENTKAWEDAGGIGILYKDSVQTIHELQKHLKTPEKFYKLAVVCAERNVCSSVYMEMYMLEENERVVESK